MNILFVVDSVNDQCGANVNISAIVAKELSKTYCVDILSQTICGGKVSKNIIDSFDNVYSFENRVGTELTYFIEKHKWSEISKLKKFTALASSFEVFNYINYFCLNNRYLRDIYKKEIEELIKKREYDAIIAVCMPHFLADVLSNVRVKCKKGIYQLDPYSYHQMLNSKNTCFRVRREKRWVKKMDFYITTPIILEEFKRKRAPFDYSKIYALDFPLISEIDGFKSKERISEKIEFVYAGNFYPTIRSPRFLLKLFEILPDNYILHIIGKGAENEINEAKCLSNNRIIYHGWVPPHEAKEYVLSADILININNDVTNMLPSKLFEYMSTGKPILNICKSENCASMKYIHKYGNAINMIEKNEVDANDVKLVTDFVRNNGLRIVSFEEIKSKLSDNTVECAYELFDSIIKT